MSTLIIQPSDIDAALFQVTPNTNEGASIYLYASSTLNDLNRSVLKFDFSALPSGATISAATLSLYRAGGATGAVGRTYCLYELTQTGWVELEVTWNSYKTGSAWTTPGGDYTTTDGASLTVPSAPNWMGWNVLALVQHFRSAHGKVAHFLLKDETEGTASNYYSYFWSREYAVDTTLCPKLEITYTTVTHYTLTAEAGSYSKTGQSAGLKAARKIPAGAGSYSLAGQSAVLKAARKVVAGAGSYSLTGQLATLRAARRLAAAPDSYALTGQAVDLKLARKIAAGAGSYALTGQEVVLRAIRKMAAEGGSYVLTGMDANLAIGHHYTLVCEAGSYGEPYSKIFVTLDGRIYKKMGNTYLRLA